MFSMAGPESEFDSEGYLGRTGPALPGWEGIGTPRLPEAMDPLTPVKALAVSTLSCRSVDGRVRRYDLRKGQLFSDYVGSECGWDMVAGRGGGDSKGGPSLTNLPTPPFPPGPITCTCFSRDGQCTLVSSLDSTLRLLDKDTGELLGE